MMHYEIAGPIVLQGNYARIHPRLPQTWFGLAAHERSALIELNKAIAGLLGMHPHYTISSNLAWRLSRRTGLSFQEAKRVIHAHIARYVAKALGASGIIYGAHVDISWLVYEWLESFDNSASM